MKQFAIYSPVLGKREDVPHIFLHKAMTPDTQNCQFWNGKVRTSYGRTPEIVNASGTSVKTGDSKPIMKYLYHQADSGTKYLLAFTELNAYRWNTATNSWLSMFTCSTGQTVSRWDAASFNGKVIATNNVDAPVLWNPSLGDTFSALNATVSSGVTISRASNLIVFESHVVFGNYDTSDGETYPNGIIMSDLDDETQWDLASAGDQSAYYVEGDGLVNGFGIKNDLLYVFKNRSHRQFWYTGTETILNSRPGSSKTGTFSPDSIVNDGDGNLFFLGSDFTIREIDFGVVSMPYDETLRTINTEEDYIKRVCSAFIPEYNEVWWAIPLVNSTENNLVVCMQKNGVWYQRDIKVSAFGGYDKSDIATYTWDNQPEGAWNDWVGIWNDSTETPGWVTDICGDYYGYTYRSHGAFGDIAWDGSQMSGESVVYRFVMSTDLNDKGGLRFFKRLIYMYAYFISVNEGDVNIYIKEDSGITWNLAGTMTTAGTKEININELPLDYRARTFLIKIESSQPFEFLGAEFEYLDSGLR